jgi:hypothetical protein
MVALDAIFDFGKAHGCRWKVDGQGQVQAGGQGEARHTTGGDEVPDNCQRLVGGEGDRWVAMVTILGRRFG